MCNAYHVGRRGSSVIFQQTNGCLTKSSPEIWFSSRSSFNCVTSSDRTIASDEMVRMWKEVYCPRISLRGAEKALNTPVSMTNLLTDF
jgi:hypothetical protein